MEPSADRSGDGESAERAPHVARILEQLSWFDEPVVELWGWPGSGRSSVLEAMLAKHGPRGAVAVPARDLEDPERFRRALAQTERWVLAHAVPQGHDPAVLVASLTAELPPGRRVLLVTPFRFAIDGLPWALIGPESLRLTIEEVRRLWAGVVGRDLDDRDAEDLRTATAGWYRLLLLAAEASKQGFGQARDADELVRLPGVADFLSHRVMADLPPQEQSLLRELAAEESLDRNTLAAVQTSPARERHLTRLRRGRGLVLGGVTSDPWVPAPLVAFLRAEARSRPVPAPRALAFQQHREPPRGAVMAGEEAAARVAVHLFGRPRANGWDGAGQAQPLHWPLKRAFRLLVFLASTETKAANKDEIVAALWPDVDEETVEKNFHPTLSHLRRGLKGCLEGAPAPPILFDDGVYRMHPEFAWWVDLDQFRDLRRRGREALREEDRESALRFWNEAWQLHQGDLLEGYYESWADERREAAQREYVALLADLGQLLVGLGDAEAAIDVFRTLLYQDPLEEEIHVELMRLYAAQGRRDLVRRQYDRLAEDLRRELGIEPMPASTEIYHRLMAQGG